MKVFKTIILSVLLFLLANGGEALFAQAVYTLYPAPTTTVDVAPDGYRAVYVSHFGRHGSRFLTKREERSAYKTLSNTELPQAVKEAVDSLRRITLGHEGELSELGAREQRGIGGRMAKRLPELFGTSLQDTSGMTKIRARSSVIGRCKASMRSFLEGMQAAAPGIKESTSASLLTYRKFSRGVKHGKYNSGHPELLALAAYAWNAECLGVSKMLIVRYFTRGEHGQMLDELDSAFCHSLMPSSRAEALCAKGLLRDIISKADAALSGKRRYAADLRFGHDSAFVPLGCLMGLDGFGRNNRIGNIVPMAANIQLIFYRSDSDSSDILVKILHNEVATSIPALTPALTKNSDQYYNWSELRSFLLVN